MGGNNEERRTLRHAPHPENDPQEWRAFRQGDIALIHSAPTGESGNSYSAAVIASQRGARMRAR